MSAADRAIRREGSTARPERAIDRTHRDDARAASPRTRAWLAMAPAVAALLAVWYLVTTPSSVSVLQLLTLAAPGAVLGLAAGWATFVLHRDRFSWRVAAWSAGAGALVVPPVVLSMVTLSVLFFPAELVTLFIAGAWLALGTGLLVAGAWRVQTAVARRRAASRPQPSSSTRSA